MSGPRERQAHGLIMMVLGAVPVVAGTLYDGGVPHMVVLAGFVVLVAGAVEVVAGLRDKEGD